ncbi:MAG: hypothetical protein HC794_01400 [Nitrospiraceae bacterium]|nr:hypothetical protein [Nitrospiraceae bacterium]
MKEFDAYMTFSRIGEEDLDALRSHAEMSGINVDLGQDYIEFSYSGKDYSSSVIDFLLKLAKTVKDASGEVSCNHIDDEMNDYFEFFSIENGELYCQPGKIVRGDKFK